MEYHKINLYYGSIEPLENNEFSQNKINPFGINAESNGVCFTTSPEEAYKVYAFPPYEKEDLPEGISVLESYKSEWYNKTRAIAEKDGMVPYEKIKEVRDKFVERASPVIYKCTADIYNPFIVSEDVPVISTNFIKGDGDFYEEILDTLVKKNYGERKAFNIDIYKHNLAIILMNNSDKSKNMTDCVNESEKIFNNFFKSKIRNIKEMNTFELYTRISDELSNRNIHGKHSEVFSSGHDAIIIEDAGKIYANAEYGKNSHYLVFNTNKIKFSISEPENLDLLNKNQLRNKNDKNKIKL
jgi:hypothetical protein